MEPTQTLNVSMQLQHWNAVLNMLGDHPYKHVAGYIHTIQQQCAQQEQQPQQVQVERPPQRMPPQLVPADEAG